jgi:hypothetical protein
MRVRKIVRLHALVFAIIVSLWAQSAQADPIRLRGDALAETQAPAGLVVVQGEDKLRPWVNAEALVWAGARPDVAADVLVLSVRMRAPHGIGEVRAGRFVFTAGAIRPVQIDGISGLARAPWGSTVEAMVGAPAVPRLGFSAYDWIAAGRVAQSITDRSIVGFSYVQERDHAEIANQEVGADFSAVPLKWMDVAARGTYDLTSPGIADALISAAARTGDFRVEGFATHRSPSRLLPATSLFSVLGDFPSDTIGTTIRWNAAPRLDIWATGAGQVVGGDVGGNASLRTLLKLNDKGTRNIGLELRRQDVSTAKWTGVRAVGVQPIGKYFRFSSELEVALPDVPNGRGSVWPWGLMALAWRSGTGWEVATASEGSSTPEHRFELNALLRLSRVLEIP